MGIFHAWHVVREGVKKPTPLIERSAITRNICGLYCTIACVFGVVFPISDAITSKDGVHGYYTEVFHLYMYLTGIAALIFIFVDLIRKGKKEDRRELELHGNPMGEDTPNQLGPPMYEQEIKREDDESARDPDMEFPDVSHEGEGVNFYLRLGAVGFGLGTMLLSGFRISEPLENNTVVSCRSPLFQLNAVLLMIFVFVQTFFIFKHHRVIINRRKPIVRLCLMHLIATNLSIWLSSTTHETAEDIGRNPFSQRNIEKQQYLNGTTTLAPDDERMIAYTCHHTHTLSDLSAPYLFPCMIEYTLIGAAVCYRIYLNIGKAIVRKEVRGEVYIASQGGDECHKSTTGLFLGLIMVLLTLIAIALFFVFDNTYKRNDVSGLIFVCSELFLMTSALVATIVGILMMRNLDFVGKEEDSFDDKLLMVAQIGYYVLVTFIGLAAGSALTKGDHMPLAPLYFLMSIVAFFQTTVQTFFILDGFSRCPAKDEHVHKKPGRSILTFLLVTNLSMWATATFEVKKSEVAELQVSFYQYLPWSIIMHLCLPLVIFYRFHSSVCLSDIWHHAYIKRKED